MEEKRKSGRAVILVEDNIATMYREFQDRIFYTFPGGGVEGDETPEECVVREVKEELGIDVKVIEKLYDYEGVNRIEYFYLCEWVSGEFGTGAGEEFQSGNDGGIYRPTFMRIKDIPDMPLMPPDIAARLYNDFKDDRFKNKIKKSKTNKNKKGESK